MFATSATVIQSNMSGRSFSLPLMYLHQWRSPLSVCSSSLSCPSVPGESLVPELCPPWWQRSDQLSLSSSDGERSPVGFGSDTRPGLAEPVSDRNMYHLRHQVPPDSIYMVGEQTMSFKGAVHPEMLAMLAHQLSLNHLPLVFYSTRYCWRFTAKKQQHSPKQEL